MEITGSVIIQLAVAALLVSILFYGAYSMPRKVAAICLLLLIPFQPIDTNYFTANVLLTYGIFIGLLLRAGTFSLPMLPQVSLLLFCYMLSFSQVFPGTYVQHAVYLFALVSAVFVFWISYDLTRRFDNPRSMVHVFLVINVAVVIYCAIQIAVGPGTKVVLFGIEELSMMPMRKDARLTGPFGAAGITAEYFAIMTYLVIHEILSSSDGRNYRRGLAVLAGVNVLLLVTTGNRGAFVTLIAAAPLYLWFFRKELGVKRVIVLLTGGTVVIVLASIVAVNFTQFGRLFDRLATTEIEEGIPDTRQVVWPFAWKEIKRQPILGHGPRLRFPGEDEGTRYKGHQYIRYPHNFYLYLLFTVGIVGLVGVMTFLLTPLIRCLRTSTSIRGDPYLLGLAKTGSVVMIIFFVDQMKVSFMRLAMVDYWHFYFALMGMFVAVCDLVRVGNEKAEIAGARISEPLVPTKEMPSSPQIARKGLTAMLMEAENRRRARYSGDG